MNRMLAPIVLGLALQPVLSYADPAQDKRQEAAIQDTQAWVSGIVSGLGTLAPPPSAALAPARNSSGSSSAPRRTSPRPRQEAQASIAAVVEQAPVGNSVKEYEYNQKGRYTEVNIKIKDRLENGASRSFRVTVTSTQPLSAWTIRVKGTDTVVGQGGLFGETSFSKTITEPYRPDFVMNLTVKRDGSDWVDYFKLFNEGTVQSR